MTEPGRPSGPGSDQPPWSQPTEPLGNQYPSADPAYAGTYNYPGYVPPNTSDPTRALPNYWTQPPYPPYPPPQPSEPPPPPPPKSPRWLWLVAGGAVVLVLGLVAALLIANGAERDDTVVAPLPTVPNTATSTTPSPPTTIAPAPSATAPRPTTTSAPETAPPGSGPTTPGTTSEAATESVVYNVSGVGRAISITYVDTGGLLQMEFNVVLPWSREVTLSESTVDAASVTVVNVGREVSCSVTVNGVQVQQQAGNGLTICAGRR